MSDQKHLDERATLCVENMQLRAALEQAYALVEKIRGDWRTDTSDMLAMLTEARAIIDERSKQYDQLFVLYNQLAAIVEGRTRTSKAPTLPS